MIRAAATLCLLLTASAPCFGQFTFAEEFNGGLSNTWGTTPSFPQLDVAGPTTFVGLPAHTDLTLDGAQTFRFTNTLAPRNLTGMVAAPTLIGPRGEVTARINTLTQDGTRIDGFFLMMLVDAQDSTKWLSTAFFGSNYSTNRLWGGQASFAAASNFAQNYTNDTWYRPQLLVNGRILRASLLADNGTTLLGQYEFIAPEGYFSGRWNIAIGQYMGTPNAATYMTDVAVDWVRAETLACGTADIGSAGAAAEPDGILDNNDFIVYIDRFFSSDPRADIGSVGATHSADGLFDNNDFIVYIDEFFAGC
ncbi:MAG: GC-type dockerin domain-anchored protein [Phycisphaerales bacterium]|nr:GC-type dockerin domain-anchored protein [Phycisphaerales bacterium]